MRVEMGVLLARLRCDAREELRYAPSGWGALSDLAEANYVTLNLPLLVAVPARVMTVTWPLVAPAGTVTTIFVPVSDTIVAGAPLKATWVAPARFRPVMVTVLPTAPDFGLTLMILGVTGVVTCPIELPLLVNHKAPLDPVVIPIGLVMPLAV